MHADHRHPGCSVIRAAFTPPRSTTSTFVLSGARVSSGDAKLLLAIPDVGLPLYLVRYIVGFDAEASASDVWMVCGSRLKPLWIGLFPR
jgi:hypothetical protein